MRDLLGDYARAPVRFDELLGPGDQPRPHWAALIDLLARAEPERVRERTATIEREIRDSGLTYNIYADPEGQTRPWSLDGLPMIIPAPEWAQIEAGVAQRARLMNALLADFYGPQTLLADGSIPPALVLGHGAFQRAARGADLPGGVALFSYAVDLARAPNGQWWAIADRTQAPSGAGYSVENRLIVSRVFPRLFRDLHTQRIAGFFATLRDSLRRLAPQGDGAHLTVLLTPGPYNETYSEHSLLSRYLGFTLVEGHDLLVRNGKVWLKTVDGLRRVHAILRRQDDDFCDPLELRSDSALGVAGLVDCARRGTVFIANAIGSGVLESGALMGFFPRLSERLLGEPLQMPSVATWWLGEPAALADALPRLHELVFKPVDRRRSSSPIFGADLDAVQARALAETLRRNPADWFAQELVQLAQAPVNDPAHPGQLTARSVGLRVFAVASRDGYSVMPGGLTRVAPDHDARIISMQRGGASKDTWVLSAAPVNASLTLLQSTVGAADLVRSNLITLSSRAAENLFWFGRYCERAEDSARLLRVALPRLLVDDDDRTAQAPLLAFARTLGLIAQSGQSGQSDSAESTLLDAVFDADRLGALPGSLQQVQRLAFSLRERLSTDHWRTINRLLLDSGFDGFRDLPQAIALLDRTVSALVTLSGFTLDGMTHDTGWRFLSLGRRIERLRAVCGALSTAVREGRSAGLDWLLEFCDSTITYRSRYMGQPEWLPVLDLLIRDDTNPRSVLFQLKGLDQVIAQIDRAIGGVVADFLPEPLTKLGGYDDPAALEPDAALADWLDSVSKGAALLSERLSMRFFTPAQTSNIATFAA